MANTDPDQFKIDSDIWPQETRNMDFNSKNYLYIKKQAADLMASQSYSKFVIGGSGRHEGVIKSKVSKKELISWQANDNYIRFTCMLLTNYSGGLIKNKSS